MHLPPRLQTESEAPGTALPAAATSWLSLAAGPSSAAAAGTDAHLLLPDSVGRSALAVALQQGLGLASTAKTAGGGGEKERGGSVSGVE